MWKLVVVLTGILWDGGHVKSVLDFGQNIEVVRTFTVAHEIIDGVQW